MNRSFFRNINHVVVRISVDKLVVGIDSGKSGLLVDNNLESLVFLEN